MRINQDSVDQSVYFYITGDASNASPGDPITGLLFSDIETGGSASYMRRGGARVDLTLITLASASAVHADGGFILVDDTNMPGVYRCDYPDAAFIAGVDQVILHLVVATAKNASVIPILVELTDLTEHGAVKKNAALSDIPFYMVQDSGDHVTPATGLTVTEEVSKDGGAFAAAAGSFAETGNGAYSFDATAADMNADVVVFKFTATGADPTLVFIKTVS